CGGKLQGDPGRPAAAGPGGRDPRRRLPRPPPERTHRQLRSGHRLGVRPDPGRERHRQLHQDHPAGAGAHPAGRRVPRRPAPRPVGRGQGRPEEPRGRQLRRGRRAADADRRPGADGGPVTAAAPAAGAGPRPEVDWTALLLGFAGMVIGQFMAILDIQIVASSLPQIQAGVGASADEISWIQTAYLIPEVVMIPLSGYLARLWGTRNVFLASCTGFMVMSVATGLSTSIEAMIVFRALQGFVGGAMIPTVFAVAFTAFPPERRVIASVVMG